MSVGVQILFSLISLVHYINIFFVFIDLYTNDKKQGKDKASQLTIYLAWILVVVSPAYTFILGYVCRQVEKKGGFFANLNFHYKATMCTFGFAAILWFLLTLVDLNLDSGHFTYVGLFLFLNSLASTVFMWAVWTEKEKIAKAERIANEEVEAQPINDAEFAQAQQIVSSRPQRENEANEDTELSFLKWYNRLTPEKRNEQLNMCQYFYMQKWKEELKQGRELGIDCPLLRRLNNEMSQQCWNLDLTYRNRRHLKYLAEQRAHTVTMASVRGLNRPTVPPYQEPNRSGEAPPAYTSRQASMADELLDVEEGAQ